MTGEDVNVAIKNVCTFLDKIDLKPYIKEYKSKDIRMMMNRLEESYLYIDDYSESLFDSVTVDEFIIYLEDRYDVVVKVETEIIYKIK